MSEVIMVISVEVIETCLEPSVYLLFRVRSSQKLEELLHFSCSITFQVFVTYHIKRIVPAIDNPACNVRRPPDSLLLQKSVPSTVVAWNKNRMHTKIKDTWREHNPDQACSTTTCMKAWISKHLWGSCILIQLNYISLSKERPRYAHSMKSSPLSLGECRTLWGEHGQAMHYSIDCYVAKALPVFVLPACTYSGCCSYI